MKLVTRQMPQGDVLFTLCKNLLPKNATLVPHVGELVIAHSETGHHHVIDRPDEKVEYYSTPDSLVSYLRLKGRAVVDVLHLRNYDTHEALRLDAGSSDSVWEIRRQREYNPIELRRVQD